MTVGERIKLRRLELKMSQSELAEKAGYSDKSAISKLEHSGNDITLKQLKRIAEALDVPSSYLIGWQTHQTDEYIYNEFLKDSSLNFYKIAGINNYKQREKELYENLLKAAHGNSPENIQLAIDMLIRLKGK